MSRAYTNPLGVELGPLHPTAASARSTAAALFEGQRPDHHPAGPAAQAELHPQDKLRSPEDQPGARRQDRDRGDLCRCGRRPVRTARRNGDPVGLYPPQRAADAAVGDRQALRPGHRRRDHRKNYAYQITSSVNVFFEDKILNPFVGAGALAMIINDFNGDNFDHSGLGFIGAAMSACCRPAPGRSRPTSPRTARRPGAAPGRRPSPNYLRTAAISTHGAVMSHRATISTSIRPIATYTDDRCCG